MTWRVDIQTGDVINPNGTVVGNLGDPPYTIPTDAQKWGEKQFRKLSMSELTTDELANYAELWRGDVQLKE